MTLTAAEKERLLELADDFERSARLVAAELRQYCARAIVGRAEPERPAAQAAA